MKIDLPEKRYYSIGEVASKFQVKTSLIRFWEQEFKILNPKKNSRGNRKFTSKDIENFNKIYFLLKEKGYTIQGAKDYIKNNSFMRLLESERIKEKIRNFEHDMWSW